MNEVLSTLLWTGVACLVIIAPIWWTMSSGTRWWKRLEARAATGDRDAQAELARANELKSATERAAGGRDPERERLLASGLAARAIILSVRPLGIEVSASAVPTRLVEVDLSIEGREGQPVTVRDAVSELYLGRLLKGASVPVRVDPFDARRVAVLWDTL